MSLFKRKKKAERNCNKIHIQFDFRLVWTRGFFYIIPKVFEKLAWERIITFFFAYVLHINVQFLTFSQLHNRMECKILNKSEK